MRSSRLSTVALFAVPLSLAPLLAACGSSGSSGSTSHGSGGSGSGGGGETSVSVVSASGLSVETKGGDRLVVSSADGRVLLDGLPPGSVKDDAAPLVGFATRQITTTYEMQYGAFKPTETDGGAWKVAAKLASKGAGALDLEDSSGKVLAHLVFTTPEQGHLVAAITPGDGPETHLSWGFACDASDHFAGFGAQSLDVDHKGFTVPTWVEEQGVGKQDDDSYGPTWFLSGTRHASQIPIPQYLAKRGYILTAENDLRSQFALCSESKTAARVEVEMPAKIHVFDGPTPAEALARSSATFGRPRMPPRVAFAPWLDAIFGSDNVKAVAQKLRDKGVPSSVIWTEDWRGGAFDGDAYRLKEDWDVDTTLYPDLKGLTDTLHGEGFQFFVYYNPFVFKASKAWTETQPKGYLVKKPDGSDYVFTGATFEDTGLIDLYNPDARAWAVGKMREAIAQGADGWMNDFGEWLPTDGMTGKGPSLPLHNPYAVAWQETAREAIDGVNDGVERLFFGRSGWFGTPALADVIWAGDQRTDFEPDDGFPTVLPIGIGLGTVGISTFGHDIGGYQSATNPVATKELFFRWTELGAFSPVMRTHHGTNPKQQWNWQSDDETVEHFKRYAKLHIALVPYLEGLAKVASASGLPMWRGLQVAFPDDEKAWGIKDQVMLGDGVLVAPVVTAGATGRGVYLPKGNWYPWSGGAPVAGGADTQAQAPLAEIPVFAAEGALVPTYPDGVMTLVNGSAQVPDASSVGDDRVVLAFLGAKGSFTEAGGLAYSLDHQAAASGDLTLTWQGTALAACAATPAAPCAQATADGATAYVTGPGSLAVSAGGKLAATLTATGGAATRKLTWVVRR